MTNSLPPVPPPAIVRSAQPRTNSYHFDITCDSDTNAKWYSVVVRSNNIEVQRRYSMINRITISNLGPDLSNYRFTMTATNSLGESDESIPLATKLVTVQTSDDLISWTKAPSVVYDPSTNSSRFLRLSNFNAAYLLQPD